MRFRNGTPPDAMTVSACTLGEGLELGDTEGDSLEDGDTLAETDGETLGETDAEGLTDGLGPISLKAAPTAPQSSEACVQVIAWPPAVACSRYCPPPPVAPSSVSYRDVPVRAEGANVCQPPAVTAK
jgi:hypothetical protein